MRDLEFKSFLGSASLVALLWTIVEGTRSPDFQEHMIVRKRLQSP